MENANFHIRLEARNRGRGHFRAYSIEAAQNLFGEWDIEVKFGRIGRRGRSVIYSAADDATAAAIVRNCLHRRASAPKRIGVRYQIRELCDPKEWAALKV